MHRAIGASVYPFLERQHLPSECSKNQHHVKTWDESQMLPKPARMTRKQGEHTDTATVSFFTGMSISIG